MRISFAAAVAALALSATAQAAAYRAGGLEVVQPWSRPAAAGTNGAGFMTVSNKGKTADTLKTVETPAARKAEIHQTSMAGGIMSMKRLDAGLPIGPGESVTFAPGGYHLMLVGLTKASKAGDKIPATLVFASGARIKIEFPVGAGPAAAPMSMPMGDMDHMHH
jgi:copper(I)-binding protein